MMALRYEYRVRGNTGEVWEDSPYQNLRQARRGLAECRYWEQNAYESDFKILGDAADPLVKYWIERRPVAKWERV